MTLSSIDTIRAALDCIPPNLPRDDWARVAMALKSELGAAEGFELFDAWSSGADAYDAKSTRSTWRSVKAGGAVGIGTLFHLAQQHGFKFDVVQTPAPPPSAVDLKARAEARKTAAARERAERDRAQRDAAAEAARQPKRRDSGSAPARRARRPTCSARGCKRTGCASWPMVRVWCRCATRPENCGTCRPSAPQSPPMAAPTNCS